MAINARVSRLLEEHGLRYEVISHLETIASQQVAHAAHISGHDLAKAVVLHQADGRSFLVVLPASQQVRLRAVHEATGRDGLRFATESEIARLFPDCDPGAVPPFGRLYGLATHLDPCLLGRGWIYFQPGSHREVVRVRGREFEDLVHPATVTTCMHESLEPLLARGRR